MLYYCYPAQMAHERKTPQFHLDLTIPGTNPRVCIIMVLGLSASTRTRRVYQSGNTSDLDHVGLSSITI